MIAQYDGQNIEVKGFNYAVSNENDRFKGNAWSVVSFYVEVYEEGDTKEEYEAIREELVQAQDEIRDLRGRVAKAEVDKQNAENILANYKAAAGYNKAAGQAYGYTGQVNTGKSKAKITVTPYKSKLAEERDEALDAKQAASYEAKRKQYFDKGFDGFFHDAGDDWGK